MLLDVVHPRVTAEALPQSRLDRRVDRPVLDDDHLERRRFAGEERCDRLDHRASLLARRHDHADRRERPLAGGEGSVVAASMAPNSVRIVAGSMALPLRAPAMPPRPEHRRGRDQQGAVVGLRGPRQVEAVGGLERHRAAPPPARRTCLKGAVQTPWPAALPPGRNSRRRRRTRRTSRAARVRCVHAPTPAAGPARRGHAPAQRSRCRASASSGRSRTRRLPGATGRS